LAFQDARFVPVDPEHEIAGKAGQVSFYGAVEVPGRDFVERGQIAIKHHFLAT
jgi:hypothetical protein